MEAPREYWAFISYCHTDNREPGREWASWIAREIETYEVPADLVGTKGKRGDTIPERIYPVFRDEDELSADADLSSPIYQALGCSKILVSICSPRAVGSRYVDSEIAYFKSLGHEDRVLAMMIEGEPHAEDGRACFPGALRHPVDDDGQIDATKEAEPVAADFRLPDGSQGWYAVKECRSGLSDERAVTKYLRRCEHAKLKIIAGILGVPLGQLIERDKAYQLERARKRARIVSAVAAALGLLALLAVAGGIFAWQKKQEAARERDRAVRAQAVSEHARGTAEDLIRQILFDLEGKLEPLGRLDLLNDVSRSAERYFVDLPSDQITAESERNRSAMFDARARVLQASGDLEGALARYQKGLCIARSLASGSPGDSMLKQDVAISLKNIGDILIAMNRAAEAQEAFRESAKLLYGELENLLGSGGAETLIASLRGEGGEPAQSEALEFVSGNPGIPGLLGTSAVLAERLANAEATGGDTEEAMMRYSAALKIQQALAVADPDSRALKRGQAISHQNIGNMHMQMGDLAASAASFREMIAIARTELASDPRDVPWQEILVGGLDRLATIATREGRAEESVELSTQAMETWRALAAADPTNLNRKRNHFVGLFKLAHARKAHGDKAAAAETFGQARTIARELLDADPDNAAWRRDLAFSLEQLANHQRERGEVELSEKTTLEAIGHHRQLAKGDPDNLGKRRNLLLALNGLAIQQWVTEDLDAATRTMEESVAIARSIIADLSTPTLQSRKDLAELCVYLGQIAEQAERFADSERWYVEALELNLDTRELGLIEISDDELVPLRERIEVTRAQQGGDAEGSSTDANE